MNIIFLYDLSASLSESLTKTRVSENFDTTLSKSMSIVWLSLESIILDDLTDSLGIDAHDRKGECHCFKEGDPLCFSR